MINPASTDVSLLLSLNGDGGATLDFLMYHISARLTWVPLYLFLIYAVWKKEGLQNLWKFVVVVALMVLLADQMANLFKTFLPKLRPSHNPDLKSVVHIVNDYRGGLYGTVSSHAANCFALFVLISMVFKRWWVWVSLGLWAVVVSYSRIYLAVHFPYDVFFGAILGVGVGFLAYWAYNKFKLKWKNSTKS